MDREHRDVVPAFAGAAHVPQHPHPPLPDVTGQSPGGYLTRWRMGLAAARLRDTLDTISRSPSATRLLSNRTGVPYPATVRTTGSDRTRLDHGYHVITEGILHAARYADMLTQLAADHRGTTVFYYLDVSWGETLRRHATRPQAAEFGPEHMRSWYQHHGDAENVCQAATCVLGISGPVSASE